MEHAEAFPTQADELALLDRLRRFGMVKKIGLGRRFESNGTHFGWFPARALLVSVGGELRNVFPCELENRYVGPEDFLESLLKREPCTAGGVERRKRVNRHDRLADHLAANPDMLEPGLTLCGKEMLVSSTSGEGARIDLLFPDRAGRFLIVEVKVKPEELDKAVGQLRRHARLYVETFHSEAARRRLAVACPYSSIQDRRICRDRNYVLLASGESARHGLNRNFGVGETAWRASGAKASTKV